MRVTKCMARPGGDKHAMGEERAEREATARARRETDAWCRGRATSGTAGARRLDGGEGDL